jgi:hypothetical protein
MTPLSLKTLLREKKMIGFGTIFSKMTPLPLKTLIREKNDRVWNHIFKNGNSNLQNPNKRKEC